MGFASHIQLFSLKSSLFFLSSLRLLRIGKWDSNAFICCYYVVTVWFVSPNSCNIRNENGNWKHKAYWAHESHAGWDNFRVCSMCRYNNNFSRKTCSAPENCYLCMTFGMMGLVIHTLLVWTPRFRWRLVSLAAVDWMKFIFILFQTDIVHCLFPLLRQLFSSCAKIVRLILQMYQNYFNYWICESGFERASFLVLCHRFTHLLMQSIVSISNFK